MVSIAANSQGYQESPRLTSATERRHRQHPSGTWLHPVPNTLAQVPLPALLVLLHRQALLTLANPDPTSRSKKRTGQVRLLTLLLFFGPFSPPSPVPGRSAACLGPLLSSHFSPPTGLFNPDLLALTSSPPLPRSYLRHSPSRPLVAAALLFYTLYSSPVSRRQTTTHTPSHTHIHQPSTCRDPAVAPRLRPAVRTSTSSPVMASIAKSSRLTSAATWAMMPWCGLVTTR